MGYTNGFRPPGLCAFCDTILERIPVSHLSFCPKCRCGCQYDIAMMNSADDGLIRRCPRHPKLETLDQLLAHILGYEPGTHGGART